jgi:hypothetical protein
LELGKNSINLINERENAQGLHAHPSQSGAPSNAANLSLLRTLSEQRANQQTAMRTANGSQQDMLARKMQLFRSGTRKYILRIILCFHSHS